MILVELISKEDCSLCDKAKEVLLDVQRSHPFELKEIKIKENDSTFEQYKEQIPVVLINNTFAFRYKVQQDKLIQRLTELRQ